MRSFRGRYFPIILSILLLGGCEDIIMDRYIGNVPVYMSYEELRSSVFSEPARSIIQPGKIYFYNDFIFINEYLEGIHVVDNSDPENPQNIQFINIPGNIDLAIKNDIIFADNYIDIVSIDISNLSDINEISRLEDVLPYYLPPTDNDLRIANIDISEGVVVEWNVQRIEERIKHKTWDSFGEYSFEDSYINHNNSIINSGLHSYGVGGSMARFTICNNILYAIDDSHINVMDINNEHLYFISDYYVGWNIETIFPYDNCLYIGSMSGMIILDVSNPANPSWISEYTHITSCDPVVVSEDYAYVTLRSGNECGSELNQLQVIDIADKKNPTLIKTYPMIHPHGLGIDKNTLFLCDGVDGLKIYDIADPMSITDNMLAHFQDIDAFDVIPINSNLILIGEDGLFQYDYANIENIQLRSSILFE